MDIKKILSIVDGPAKQSLTEGKNMAKGMVMQHYSKPAVNPVTKYRSNINEYFKVVDTEMLSALEESQEQKKVAVKNIVNRVLTRLDESKTTKDKPAVRNFVAKNAQTSGAGKHQDSSKKKNQEQGKVKHKKDLVPMDEERTEVRDKDGNVTSWKDEGEWKKSTAKKDGRGKVTNLSDKARRETEKLSKKEKEVAEVAGPKKCWPGHRKTGTQPGTGKNAGKRVNDCEKIEEGRNREDDWDEGNTEPPNNFAIYINDKKWKVLAGRGTYADDYREKAQYRQLQDMCARKSEATGKKWTVHVTGEPVSEQLAESAYGSIKVGSPVKVYSNVLKKSVFGKVVDLKEGRAYVQYNNTKIVMRHPIETVQLKENATTAAATTVAKAAPGVAGKMASRLIPGLGAAVGAYDAYDRVKKGDYIGAGLSGLGAVTSLIPGVGTAATMGLTGAQLARDYKMKTGAFASSEPTPGQTATPAGKYPTTDAEIKAFQTANKLTPDGKIGPKTQAALDAAGLKKPAQTATPAAAPGSNVAAAARTVAPAASAIAQRALK
jgi:peptidoglycan hydrolase-like protein with peptidoglycan-binding domain